MSQYLTFMLQGRPYAVPISTVREINRMSDVAPVPQTPDYVAGVMNLRGKVIPVIHLRRRFGFGAKDATKETCIVVLEGRDGQIGAVVDSVSGVIELSAEQIDPPPTLGEMANLDFVLGLGKLETGVVILVDAAIALARTAEDFQTIAQLTQQEAA